MWLHISVIGNLCSISSDVHHRGNPSIQANSVLALCGAVVSVSHFAASLDDRSMKDSDAATEHLGLTHWLSVAIDTILSLWNINYKPHGKLLGLCQQVC